MLIAALIALQVGVQQPATPRPEPWRPRATILDAYSRNIALAVAVEPRDSGASGIASGAGGDVFLLNYERAKEPGLSLARAEFPYTWSTNGVVLDIALAADFSYVAAFRDGLRVFARSDPRAATPSWAAPRGQQVNCVAALDVEIGKKRERFVAIGTESFSGERGGVLHLFLHDRVAQRLVELASIDLGAAVFTLAGSTTSTLPGASVTLLIGTGNGRIGANERALQRLDVALRDDGERIKSEIVARVGWSASDAHGDARPTIIRDIALDPPRKRAYVAAFWDGVWAFDLSPEHGGLAPIVGDGWPLRLANDPEHGYGCACETGSKFAATVAHAVALTRELDGGAQHLVLALGPPRTDVSCVQTLSKLDQLPPYNTDAAPPEVHECRDSNARGQATGIFAFELRDGAPRRLADKDGVLPTATLAGAGPKGQVAALAFSLAVAGESTDGYDVYVASVAFGVQVLRAAHKEALWSLERVSAWNGTPPARMPMPAFDDLLFLRGEQDVLFASSEGALAAFEFAAENKTPLSRPWLERNPKNARNPTTPWIANTPAILLTHFDGANARLVAGTRAGAPLSPGGLAFFDVVDPTRPRAAGDVELDRDGFGYGIVAARGLREHENAGETRRFLYSVQELKASAKALESWCLRLWDIGTASAPLDPRKPANGAAVDPCSCGPRCLASYATPTNERIELSGLAVLDDRDDIHHVYSLYNPRPLLDGEALFTGDVGLLAFEARRSDDGGVALRPLDTPRVAAFERCTWEHRGVRATVDREKHRLYAAWVGLLAIYDIRDPAHPRLLARRDLRGEHGAYGLVPTPVQIAIGPTLDSREYVYIALLNDGVGVLDATDAHAFETAPLHVMPTPWQTTSVIVDPRDASRRRLFVAEGTRGLEWIELR